MAIEQFYAVPSTLHWHEARDHPVSSKARLNSANENIITVEDPVNNIWRK